MKKLLKYLGMLSVVVLCLSVATIAPAVIGQAKSGTTPYGYYGYNSYGCSGNYPGNYPGSYPGNYSGSYPGGYPYPRPTGYCVRWVPGRWVPVRITIPGRWEYRRVWIPGYPTTLYRPVPGYWQRTNNYTSPDLSVWKTSNGNWYATPYQQGQQGQSGGYFDNNGLWKGALPVPGK